MLVTRIDGAIVNLCHSRGLEMDPAIDFLMTLMRINLPTNNKELLRRREMIGRDWNDKRPEYTELNENHPLFQQARERIVMMEKAINNVRHGLPHGLKRKQWRKDKIAAQTIVETFSHVISRPKPESHEEKLKDSFGLLVRTGEVCGPWRTENGIETYQGKPSLKIIGDGGKLTIAKTIAGNVTIEGIGSGQIRTTVRGSLPESVLLKIKEITNQQGKIEEIVDWDGFKGAMPAFITAETSYRRYSFYGKDGDKDDMELSIISNTGWVEKNNETGKTQIHRPKTSQSSISSY